MTATTTAPRHTAAPERRDGALVGTGTMVRFQLRRDRIKLAGWVGGFALLMLYLATALPTVYEVEADAAAVAQLFGDPVGRMLVGPGYGFDNPTLERFVANGYGLYFLILAALMSILHVSRHTRVEEQAGRAELVRANVVGRHATLTATLVTAVIANVAVAVGVLVVMLAVGGYGAGGSLLFVTGIAAIGLAFAGLATITVQLTEYSRAASGMAGAVLGAAFVLRAGGDMAEEGGTALSWVAPLAWAQQTAPFVLDRWWPLSLAVVFAVITAGVGYGLSARRDVAASLFAVRAGRDRAAASLGTPSGLALRLQRPSILGWGLALGVTGLVYGAYTDALIGALADLPEVFVELFGGAEDMVAGYLAYTATFMAFLASAYAIMAVQSLRNEETGGRLEPVLATPVSRWSWLGANLAVSAGGVLVIMAVIGAATGVGAFIVTGDGAHVWELTLAHLNQVPAVLLVLGIAALLFGLIPRAVPVTWVLVGYGLVVGTFGPMLDLPQTANNLSPYDHAAQMPLEAFTVSPILTLTALALVAAAGGLVTLRRRGINVT